MSYFYSPEDIQELPATMYAVLVNWNFETMEHVFEVIACDYSVIATDDDQRTRPCIMGYHDGRLRIYEPGEGRCLLMHNQSFLDETTRKIAKHLAVEWEAAEYASYKRNPKPYVADIEDAQDWIKAGGSTDLVIRPIELKYAEK